MEDLKEKIEKNHRLYRALLLTVAMIISALLYNIILLPMNLVAGGTSSIATITKYLYNIDPALMVLLINIACIIISFMYLGEERTTGTILACLAYPLLIKLTSPLVQYINFDISDALLMALLSGIIGGFSSGLMYRSGYSMGGLPIINQILYEKFRIPIVKTSMVMNGTIILIGSLFFGTTNALYALIYLYINNLVVDKVLLGISNNKAFYIITEKDEEVKKYIIKDLNHTITTFEVKGGFLENKKRVMLAVIPSREYYKVTEGIKAIDDEAFFVVTDAYQVEGAK
ncbi:MAG: YitT family protein [Bacilli bacterium]|nr:YitT family protein [Bacilli bacterium]